MIDYRHLCRIERSVEQKVSCEAAKLWFSAVWLQIDWNAAQQFVWSHVSYLLSNYIASINKRRVSMSSSIESDITLWASSSSVIRPFDAYLLAETSFRSWNVLMRFFSSRHLHTFQLLNFSQMMSCRETRRGLLSSSSSFTNWILVSDFCSPLGLLNTRLIGFQIRKCLQCVPRLESISQSTASLTMRSCLASVENFSPETHQNLRKVTSSSWKCLMIVTRSVCDSLTPYETQILCLLWIKYWYKLESAKFSLMENRTVRKAGERFEAFVQTNLEVVLGWVRWKRSIVFSLADSSFIVKTLDRTSKLLRQEKQFLQFSKLNLAPAEEKYRSSNGNMRMMRFCRFLC